MPICGPSPSAIWKSCACWRKATIWPQIADALGIAYKTVANTLSRIKEKLGVQHTADLIRIAIGQRPDRSDVTGSGFAGSF